MLQYGFWINNQGRGLQRAMPIIIYIIFRVLVAVFNNVEGGSGLTWIVIGVYILFVVTSWTINSIANFFLLFHKIGKHALNNSERYAALTAVPSLLLGILLLCLATFTTIANGTRYQELLLPGLICLSLALPFGQIKYPIGFKNKKPKQLYTLALAGLGVLSLVIFLLAPAATLLLAVIYGIAFVVYTWVV